MSDCSTHAFDVPLRECPFCGGEAELVESDYGMFHTGYAVYCRSCCTKVGVTGRLGETYEWTPIYDTEAEAIAAWNIRHQCGLTDEDYSILLDELGVSERTCRWEYPQGVNGWIGYTVCSSCGEKYDECVTDTAHYCPNCGAKVVNK